MYVYIHTLWIFFPSATQLSLLFPTGTSIALTLFWNIKSHCPLSQLHVIYFACFKVGFIVAVVTVVIFLFFFFFPFLFKVGFVASADLTHPDVSL